MSQNSEVKITVFNFILKILAISLSLSLIIKYGLPKLMIPASTLPALLMILSPSIVIAIVFGIQEHLSSGSEKQP